MAEDSFQNVPYQDEEDLYQTYRENIYKRVHLTPSRRFYVLDQVYASVVNRCYFEFEKKPEMGQRIIDRCMEDEDRGVRIVAAMHALGLQYRTPEAEAILLREAQITRPYLNGVHKYALRSFVFWKEQGSLRPAGYNSSRWDVSEEDMLESYLQKHPDLRVDPESIPQTDDEAISRRGWKGFLRFFWGRY